MADDNKITQELPFETKEKDGEKALDERRIVRIIRAFMRQSEDYRRPHLDLATRMRERYQNWEVESKSIIRRANLKPAYGFTIIESVVPQITQVFLGDNHVVKMKGRDMDDMVYEDTLTDFIDIQLEDMTFKGKFPSFVKNMALDGTAFAKIPYRFKEQLVTKRKVNQDPSTGEAFIEREAMLKVMYDGPDWENIPMYDFFPDWSIKEPGNVQGMRGCVHRMYKSMPELWALRKRTTPDGRKVGVYDNLQELKDSMKAKGADAWGSPWWSDEHKQRQEGLDGSEQKSAKDAGKIEIWEYWGLVDRTGNGDLVESIITIANGDTVIRVQDNFYDCKFRPFVACPNYTRPNEFYGIPELAAVDSEIKEATAIRNARLDQINLGVNQMWLVDRAGGIDTKNLYSRPGGIIYTNDINALKPITPGDPSLASGQELGQIEANIAQTTAVGAPPVASASKSLARSATGVNYMQQFGSNRQGMKALNISEFVIKPMVDIIMMTNQQFVTDEQWVRATNPNAENPFSALPPDAFYRNFDYQVKTKMDLPDEVEFQKLQAASQIITAAEQTQPGVFKMDILAEALLRPLLGPSVKKFARTPEELQQLNMQNAMMRVQEQAANAQIGQNAPQPNAGPPGGGGVVPQ